MGKNRELVDRAWSLMESKNLEGLGEVFSSEVEFVAPGLSLRGLGQVRPFLDSYFSAFPDLQHEIVASAEAGDTIALELRVRGTHRAALRTPKGDLPATGRAITWDSCDFIRVAGGKITSWQATWDQVAFLTQMGLLPPR
jgi:predicted ester cyclase